MWNTPIKVVLLCLLISSMASNLYVAGKIKAGGTEKRTFPGTLLAAFTELVVLLLLLI